MFNTRGGTEALQWMVKLLYRIVQPDPASLESTEDDMRKALQTGSLCPYLQLEGVLPEANDPIEIASRTPYPCRLVAQEEWCQKRQRQRR